MKGIDKSA